MGEEGGAAQYPLIPEGASPVCCGHGEDADGDAAPGRAPRNPCGRARDRAHRGDALAVAAATGSRFVSVNVHVGATATDQGFVEGRAAESLRLRKRLGADVAIWADVHVKHGKSLAHASIIDEAEDAVRRGLADALIVSGSGTGRLASLDEVRAVEALELGVPVYLGSGVTEANVKEFLAASDGVIVGTALKRGGRTTAPIDPEQARRFVAAARA
jgi:uncharacterized protein